MEQRKRYDDERGSAAKRGYGKSWQKRRLRILARDEYTCQQCGKFILEHERKEAHVDHVLAKAKGGTDADDNLQTLCRSCHSRKTIQEDGGFGRAKA